MVIDTEILNFLQAGAHIVTILGIPGAIIVFFRERKKERQQREVELQQRQQQALDQLDDKYDDFMRLCLEYPVYRYLDYSNRWEL